jgi:Ricin-type beta-trefoil lectin domain
MTRKIALLFTGLALLLVIAGPANAATSQVKLRNLATGTKLLTKDPSGLVSMKDSGKPNQIWTRTDTSGGYATYSQGTGCLTGRGVQGFPVVTVEKCIPGATKQQWRLGVSKDLQLRLNGLAAEVKTTTAALQVQMAFFTVKPNQRWTQLPA